MTVPNTERPQERAGWFRWFTGRQKAAGSPADGGADENGNDPCQNAPVVLAEAPGELLDGPLERLGEGVGKVVYASSNWVVKRERSPREVIALIAVWKALRNLEKVVPGSLGKRLLNDPGRQLRFLRLMTQGAMLAIPRSVWMMTHIGEVWKTYYSRGARGESLAQIHLCGTALVPGRITFPPIRVKVGGWPGWLTVSEATERVECTLHDKLAQLGRAGKHDELEKWLDRFLEVRRNGWRRGLFSMDAHLKNFGVTGSHIVLLDTGGLTDTWEDVERRLEFEKTVAEPHTALGLGTILQDCPDIAERFNSRWRAIVNRDEVLRHWPDAG
jgi:hypothetical protein